MVHLEDNEEHLISSALRLPYRGAPPPAARAAGRAVRRRVHPPGALPAAARARLRGHDDHRGAQRVQLREPGRIASRGPASTTSASAPISSRPSRASSSACSPDDFVIVYHGIGHYANQHELLSLYLAVKLLQRRGRPVKLVRLGSTKLRRRRPAQPSRRSMTGARPRRRALAGDPRLPGPRRRLRAARAPRTTSTATACPPSCRSSSRWADRWSCPRATSATSSSTARTRCCCSEGGALEIAARLEQLLDDRELAARLGRARAAIRA